MQLTDIRGHTVTTLDLDSNSVGAWSVYDSFGNPQTSQTNTNLINYSSYGQQERATNTTGLILMGARVYNPETNQFTSKDPIKGGNENSYTYPNDPINGSDFSGTWSDDVSEALFAVLTLLSIFVCPGTEGAGCALALALGAYGGGLEGFNSSMNAKKPWWEVGINTVIGAAQALIGAKYVVKLVTKYGPRLAEYLLTTDGFTKSNLTVPYFLNTFAKEFIAGKISDTLIKTTYNKLAGYLSRLFPDKTKKTK